MAGEQSDTVNEKFQGINHHLQQELQQRNEPYTSLHLPSGVAASVDAYVHYERVVGDADNGSLLSNEEFARFEERAKRERGTNRVYAHLRNADGLDCKAIGPQSLCVCNHRFREHSTDNMRGDQAHCKDVHCRKCACAIFTYIPSQGSWSVKCNCKHDADAHSRRNGRCTKCNHCTGFHTSYRCSCGSPLNEHSTVFETREEREAAGRPVAYGSADDAPYEAMGGVTNFRSLLSGIERLEVEQPGEGSALGRLKQHRRSSARGIGTSCRDGSKNQQSQSITSSSNNACINVPQASNASSSINAAEQVEPMKEVRLPEEEHGLPGSMDELEQLHRIKGASSSRGRKRGS